MYDPRFDKLANILTTHSTKVQLGEFVRKDGQFVIPALATLNPENLTN